MEVDLHDVQTHRSAWRSALSECLRRAGTDRCECDLLDHACRCRDDNSAYWKHELIVFDRTFDLLERLLFNSDNQGSPAG